MASAHNENTTSTAPLKLLLDEKKTRVIAAEATSDFVDALLSFLTLPMGTIIRVTNHHPDSIGCLNNLYQSIQQLSADTFSTEASKSMLLTPPNSRSDFCKNLKLNVDDTCNGTYYVCPECSKWSYYLNTPCCKSGTTTEEMDDNDNKFIKREMRFVITDDLRVLTSDVSSLLFLLNEFNIGDVHRTVEISVDVGLDKVTELLKRSLLSKTPLTDVFVQRQHSVPNHTNFPNMKSDETPPLESSKLSIKLIFMESDKEILAVEANESFIDFLFSMCTIPLGSLIKLLDGDTGLGCIDNLYKTVDRMDPDLLTLAKKKITDCGVLQQYKCNSMILEIGSSSHYTTLLDPRNPKPSSECFGKFLKDNQLFVVSNNLTVKLETSSISFLKELNVRVDDIKVLEVAIGPKEVRELIKASLTSSNALKVMKISLEDKKPQIS